MNKWFKRVLEAFKIVKVPALTHEQQLEIKLNEAKLPENLAWARAQFQGSALDNGDLSLEPVSKLSGEDYLAGYAILYKTQYIGYFTLNESIDKSELKAYIKHVARFCPELFPVKVFEFYNVPQDLYNPYNTTLKLVQVLDLYQDLETDLPIYMIKDVVTNQLETSSHSLFAWHATKVVKVG